MFDSKSKRLSAAVLLVTGAIGIMTVRADQPTTAPTAMATTDPMAVAPAAKPDGTTRSREAILTDMDKTLNGIKEIMLDPDALTDAATRQKVAPQVVPALRSVVGNLTELSIADPANKADWLANRADYVAFLAVYNDPAATATLNTAANSKDPAVSIDGQGALLFVQWVQAGKDEKSLAGVIDQFQKLAKTHPESESLTDKIFTTSQIGPAPSAVRQKLMMVVIDDMKNPLAEAKAADIKTAIADARKVEELEGKPLVITGKDLNGKDFSTADWKGKVILVDFWASWCGPCKAELPRVTKLYADNHAKGLEVLGVDNDFAMEDLKKFLAANPDMPWPQLYNADAAAKQSFNPTTLGFGIKGIPVMFLIDKKGVVRTVNARENMEDLIPKMLAE